MGKRQWFKNTAKSVASIGKSIVQEQMPSTYNTARNVKDAVRDVSKYASNIKSTVNRQDFQLSNTKLAKKTRAVFETAMNDLKTGNFGIKDANDDLFNDFDDELSSDFDMDMGSDDEDGFSERSSDEIAMAGSLGVAKTMVRSTSAQLEGMEAMTKSLIGSNIRMSKASTDSISNTILYMGNTLNNSILAGNSILSAINENVSKVVEYQSSNISPLNELITNFIDESSRVFSEMNESMKRTQDLERGPSSPFKTEFKFSDGFNFKKYISKVKKDVQKSELGMIASVLPMIQSDFESSPVGTILKGIAKLAIPTSIGRAMKSADSVVETGLSELFYRIGDMKTHENPALQMLGKIFGVSRKEYEMPLLGLYNKDAIQWNGIAQRTLTDVIPNYLATMDTYLENLYTETVRFHEILPNLMVYSSGGNADKKLDRIAKYLEDERTIARQFELANTRREQAINAARFYDYEGAKFNTKERLSKEIESKYVDNISFSLSNALDPMVKAIQTMTDGDKESFEYYKNLLNTAISTRLQGEDRRATTELLKPILDTMKAEDQIKVLKSFDSGIDSFLSDINDMNRQIARGEHRFRQVLNLDGPLSLYDGFIFGDKDFLSNYGGIFGSDMEEQKKEFEEWLIKYGYGKYLAENNEIFIQYIKNKTLYPTPNDPEFNVVMKKDMEKLKGTGKGLFEAFDKVKAKFFNEYNEGKLVRGVESATNNAGSWLLRLIYGLTSKNNEFNDEVEEALGNGPGYSQKNPKWKNQLLGNSATMGNNGCGPTALAIALSQLSGKRVSPEIIGQFAANNGYITNGGATRELFTTGASTLGLSSNSLKSKHQLAASIANGIPTIFSGVGKSPYTSAGHILYANGIDVNGNANLIDPMDGKKKSYPLDELVTSATSGFALGYGDNKATSRASARNNDIATQNNGISQEAMRKFTDMIKERGIEWILNADEKSASKDFDKLRQALSDLEKSNPPNSLEDSLIQAMQTMNLSTLTSIDGFQQFVVSVFGKNGLTKEFLESKQFKNGLKKVTDALVGEEGVFKEEYDDIKTEAKGIIDSTKGEFMNAYDYAFKNVAQYIFGKDYSENKVYQKTLKFLDLKSWADEKRAKRLYKKVESGELTPDELSEEDKSIYTTMKEKQEAQKEVIDTAVNESADAIKTGTETFKDKMFGDSNKPDSTKEKTWFDTFKKTLPKALLGGAIGAGAIALSGGSLGLLGSLFLPNSIIGGAIVGSGLTILTQTNTFKDIMFGKKNDDGERQGGLISKKLSEKFKKAVPFLVGGATLGAIKSILFPSMGILSGGPLGVIGGALLPGGALGGALLGLGIGILKYNLDIKKRLFGEKDDETGKYAGGMISNGYNKFTEKLKEMLPMLGRGAAGAGIGALTGTILSHAGFIPAMFSLGGPVGAGIAGLALGIASGSKKFNEFLFGTEELDENGNPTGKRRKDGFLNRVKSMITISFIEPISDNMKKFLSESTYWLRDMITLPFRNVAGFFLDKLGYLKDTVVDTIQAVFKDVGIGILKIFEKSAKTIFNPIGKVFRMFGRGLTNIATIAFQISTLPIAAPLKMLEGLTMIPRAKEYSKFYKEYFGNLHPILQAKWEMDAKNGQRKGFLGKTADTVSAILKYDDPIKNAAREGYNERLGELGENHLHWREVYGERKKLRKDREKARKDYRMWVKVNDLRDKLQQKWNYREDTELSDDQVKYLQRKFGRMGLDTRYLQTSDDIIELIFNRKAWKRRALPNLVSDAEAEAIKDESIEFVESGKVESRNNKLAENVDSLTEKTIAFYDDVRQYFRTVADVTYGTDIEDSTIDIIRDEAVEIATDTKEAVKELYNKIMQILSPTSNTPEDIDTDITPTNSSNEETTGEDFVSRTMRHLQDNAVTEDDEDSDSDEIVVDTDTHDKSTSTAESADTGGLYGKAAKLVEGVLDRFKNKKSSSEDSNNIDALNAELLEKLKSIIPNPDGILNNDGAIIAAKQLTDILNALTDIAKNQKEQTDIQEAQNIILTNGEMSASDLRNIASRSTDENRKDLDDITVSESESSSQLKEHAENIAEIITKRDEEKDKRDEKDEAEEKAKSGGKKLTLRERVAELPFKLLSGMTGAVATENKAAKIAKRGLFGYLAGSVFLGILDTISPGFSNKLIERSNTIVEDITGFISPIVDSTLNFGVKVLTGATDFIVKNFPSFYVNHVVPAMNGITNIVVKYGPAFVEKAADVLIALAPAIVDAAIRVIPAIATAIIKGIGNVFYKGIFGSKDKGTSVSAENVHREYSEALGVYTNKDSYGQNIYTDPTTGETFVLDDSTIVSEDGQRTAVANTGLQRSIRHFGLSTSANIFTKGASGMGGKLLRTAGRLTGGTAGAIAGFALPGRAFTTTSGFVKGWSLGGKVMGAAANGIAGFGTSGIDDAVLQVLRDPKTAYKQALTAKVTAQYGAEKAASWSDNIARMANNSARVNANIDKVLRENNIGILNKLSARMDKIIQTLSDSAALREVAERQAAGHGSKMIHGIIKCITNIAKKTMEGLAKLPASKMGKWITRIMTKLGLGIAKSIPFITAGFAIWNLGSGLFEAANLFNVKDEDVDMGMRFVSSVIKVLLGLGLPGAVIDIILEVGEAITGKDYKCMIATEIYKIYCDAIGDSVSKDKLDAAQQQQELDRKIYNEMTGQELGASEYNDLVNMRASDHIVEFFTGFTSGTKAKREAREKAKEAQKIASSMSDSQKAAYIASSQPEAISIADISSDSNLGYFSTGSENTVTYSSPEAQQILSGSLMGYGSAYSQNNPKWRNMVIGTMPNGSPSTMANGGCGPTALAMVASSLTGHTVSPQAMGSFAARNGYISQGGANAGLFTSGAARLGLSSRPLATKGDMAASIASGRPVVLSGVSKGSSDPYTKAGHIVVANGLDKGGNVRVRDPMTGTSKSYSMKAITRSTNSGFAMGYGPGDNVSWDVNPNVVDPGYNLNSEEKKKYQVMVEKQKERNRHWDVAPKSTDLEKTPLPSMEHAGMVAIEAARALTDKLTTLNLENRKKSMADWLETHKLENEPQRIINGQVWYDMNDRKWAGLNYDGGQLRNQKGSHIYQSLFALASILSSFTKKAITPEFLVKQVIPFMKDAKELLPEDAGNYPIIKSGTHTVIDIQKMIDDSNAADSFANLFNVRIAGAFKGGENIDTLKEMLTENIPFLTLGYKFDGSIFGGNKHVSDVLAEEKIKPTMTDEEYKALEERIRTANITDSEEGITAETIGRAVADGAIGAFPGLGQIYTIARGASKIKEEADKKGVSPTSYILNSIKDAGRMLTTPVFTTSNGSSLLVSTIANSINGDTSNDTSNIDDTVKKEDVTAELYQMYTEEKQRREDAKVGKTEFNSTSTDDEIVGILQHYDRDADRLQYMSMEHTNPLYTWGKNLFENNTAQQLKHGGLLFSTMDGKGPYFEISRNSQLGINAEGLDNPASVFEEEYDGPFGFLKKVLKGFTKMLDGILGGVITPGASYVTNTIEKGKTMLQEAVQGASLGYGPGASDALKRTKQAFVGARLSTSAAKLAALPLQFIDNAISSKATSAPVDEEDTEFDTITPEEASAMMSAENEAVANSDLMNGLQILMNVAGNHIASITGDRIVDPYFNTSFANTLGTIGGSAMLLGETATVGPKAGTYYSIDGISGGDKYGITRTADGRYNKTLYFTRRDGSLYPVSQFGYGKAANAISFILEETMKASEKYGVPPSIELGQMGLESGWMGHPIGNNIYGLTALNDDPKSIVMKDGRRFKLFDTIEDAIHYHAKYMATSKYMQEVRDANTLEGKVKALDIHYCPGGGYSSKLMKVINSQNLTYFDNPANKDEIMQKYKVSYGPVDVSALASNISQTMTQGNNKTSEEVRNRFNTATNIMSQLQAARGLKFTFLGGNTATNIMSQLQAARGLKFTFLGGNTALSAITGTSSANQVYGPVYSEVAAYDGNVSDGQRSVVNKMLSIYGKIPYSRSGPQDPDKGSASCASTVGWAYRKALGVNGMSASSTAQSKDGRFQTIWTKQSPTDMVPLSILQPGDIMYQHWKRGSKANNGTLQHTEMYAGNGKDLSHGGKGPGPVYKDLNDYRRKHTMIVRRYRPFINGDSNLGYGPGLDMSFGAELFDIDKRNKDKIDKEYELIIGSSKKNQRDDTVYYGEGTTYTDSPKTLTKKMEVKLDAGSMDNKLGAILDVISEWHEESKETAKVLTSNNTTINNTTNVVPEKKSTKVSPTNKRLRNIHTSIASVRV